jgi:SAM-dependent methyltransferase
MTHLGGLKFEALVRNKTVLHFAPEAPLRKILLQHTANYLAADYLAEGYHYKIDFKLDLSEMPEITSGQVDLLIACDVLEHVPDHLEALREIHRVLKPGGWAVLTVPQKDHLEKTADDSSATTPQERLERFGQADHLRIYGNDFPQLLMQAGFTVKHIDQTNFPPKMVKRHVLFPPQLSTRPTATNYRKVFFAHKLL